MESQRDAELRQIHNAAGLVTPDGMPLVWLRRLMGFGHVERVYGPDLMGANFIKKRVGWKYACACSAVRRAGRQEPPA
jgi:UDP-N-acetyl-D-mannosaminuronic acid transferase (WecB/TagA/CpsF family)